MPVSADIYSQIQQPRQFEPPANPLAALAQAYQIKGLQSHIDATDRAAQTQNRLADLLRTSYDPATGAVDASKMRSGLAQAGDYAGLTNFDKTQADQAKAQRDADKARLETGLKHFEAVGQIMSGVKDQASLDAARQQAANIFGTDAARNIPTVYDPAVIARNQAQAMSVKDQLEQQYKQLTFGETQRHNQASEGLTAQGQALTARGQDMTDARARDLNATRVEENRLKREAQGTGVKLTEDQGKATGWLVQAENAFKNMDSVGFDEKGNPTGAATPGVGDGLARIPGMGGVGNWLRSDNRQKFLQGASSLSESLLRAATGAGVNKEEAAQKIAEITPQFGDSDEVIKQKRAAIPLYIESLKVRAGPGAAKASDIQNATTPAGPVGGVLTVTDAASYAKVPSGATYTTPDGKTRRKP